MKDIPIIRHKLLMFVAIGVAAALSLVWALMGHRGISVRTTGDGWVCSGDILFERDRPHTWGFVSVDKLILVERRREKTHLDGFRIVRPRQGSPDDLYFVNAFALSTGQPVYHTRMILDNKRLQVTGVWPWRVDTLIWGYVETTSNNTRRRAYFILCLDAAGSIIRRCPLEHLRPMAVDVKNNLLLCMERGATDASTRRSGPDNVVMLDLPSCDEKYRVPGGLLLDLVTDDCGYAYVLCRESDLVGERTLLPVSHIEKYSVVPWRCVWSVDPGGPHPGYPVMLQYQQGALWYAIFDSKGGHRLEDTLNWIGGPLDPETGRLTQSGLKCDTYRLEVKVNGREYVVTREGENLYIRCVGAPALEPVPKR